ncbi:hypothetical protein K1T71_007140 [Dendrolimus kikuchii]|uniref:Uncharacterized protein n=1 Tax=Dendrolimus kikuchii TaxID=765133 RepID=A0ACC1CZV7_9NEOP|nr:hypothetical protein K1T71_007140 [Dendrolimus kikuchii]
MVMVTRSAHKKACDSFDKSGVSHQKIIPPWCSSGKVYQRKRRLGDSANWEVKSEYPIRENIWEYLYENNFEKLHKRKHRTFPKHMPVKGGRSKITVIFFIMIVSGIIVGLKASTGVIEECWSNIRHLKAKLFKAEQLLSYDVMQPSLPVAAKLDKHHIHGARVLKGVETKEWGGRVTLWGVVPLWRATRPLSTILSLRKLTPGDCWPFAGTYGEIIIDLPKIYPVSCISIEHIHPDAARSAPKRFVLYGIQTNDTLVKVTTGQFDNNKLAKQYFCLHQDTTLKSIILRVVTNSGNLKYTCIYRVHVYSSIIYNDFS